ncbi:zinc finger protein 511, partial [Anolis carolinensis]|uniref:zinc finger protein 511 n=1 Tax=Anolis carolinensis TaxID=28377 RepID=UPI002F2B1907
TRKTRGGASPLAPPLPPKPEVKGRRLPEGKWRLPRQARRQRAPSRGLSASARRGSASPPTTRSSRAEVRCHFQGCGEAFASLAAFEHHYELLHRDACSACRRAFPSRRLLDLHLLEQHGAALFQLQAQQRCMFQCLVEGCPEAFRSPEDRKEHLVAAHCYPPDFRFDKTPKRGSRAKARRPRSGEDGTAPMEVADQKEMAEEAMEEGPKGSRQARRQVTPRVPASISFGQGAPRAFEGRSGRRKRP